MPISNRETSIVYSLKGGKRLEIESLIRKFNTKYKINKINKINSFELMSSNLRSYYHKNILAFGDLLHKIHPLAGQGFNMSIRDIKVLIKIIDFKIDLGLDLDSSICVEFENKNKHKNYIFSKGIDFIHEFFNLENRINSNMQTFKEYIQTDEALTRQQRIARGRIMKRMAKKIARKKKIAMKKMATPEKLEKRARKLARKILTKKILKNRKPSDLSFAEREKLEDKLKKKSAVIGRIARKLKPKVKKAEMERLKRVRGTDGGEE